MYMHLQPSPAPTTPLHMLGRNPFVTSTGAIYVGILLSYYENIRNLMKKQEASEASLCSHSDDMCQIKLNIDSQY